MTIGQALEYTKNTLSSSRELREAHQIASIIFKEVFSYGSSRQDSVFQDIDKLDEILAQLNKNVPLDYILGHSIFYGFKFMINKHVLIPRPETEELVHWVVKDFTDDSRPLTVLDIGSGSGCIAITLKKKNPTFRISALEKSKEAMSCIHSNAEFHEQEIQFLEMDFLDRDLWGAISQIDVIVSNPPYIGENEKPRMGEGTLKYEPMMALFPPSGNALEFYRAIHDFSEIKLNPRGRIYLELNEFCAQEIVDIFDEKKFEKEIKTDLQGKIRMLRLIRKS